VSAEQDAAREVTTLYQQNRFADLESAARRWLVQFPDASFLWKALGVACGALGKRVEALDAKQRAVDLAPRDGEAHSNLANALLEVHRTADAESHFRKAIELDEKAINPLRGLAELLGRAGRFKEAAQCRGRICVLQPSASAYNDWGNVLRDAQDMPAAHIAYEQALKADPRMAEALSNLANTLVDLGQPREAERRYRQALEVQPNRAEIHSNLGNLLKNQGRHAEALEVYREAMRLNPSFVGGQANYMLALNNVPGLDPQFVKSEALAFGRWASARVGKKVTPAPASPDGIVRVGFVSGDLRRHPVGYFLDSTLQHWPHDRATLTAYVTAAGEDILTERIKPHFDHWRPVNALTDEEFAEQVIKDGIDVLVDLAGHTAHSRLTLFAWRPARVQATWLGYFATTGIEQMDWLLSDEVSIKPQEEGNFTERIWRLPGTRICFSPPEEQVEVSGLPAFQNNFVTFGCFQNTGKINDEVLGLWARVMEAVPDSRLRVQNVQLAEREMQVIFLERLARAGIAPERVSLAGRMLRHAYLKAHSEVDIVLDTFPYPGGTTTCEALWMGVPTLTLAGDTLLSRQGESLLTAAGMPEWVARTPDDYVAKAKKFAGNIDRLAAIRATLRQRAEKSALFDAPRFAGELVDAFVSMASGAR
jgi:protein O-GlcNAc transferase